MFQSLTFLSWYSLFLLRETSQGKPRTPPFVSSFLLSFFGGVGCSCLLGVPGPFLSSPLPPRKKKKATRRPTPSGARSRRSRRWRRWRRWRQAFYELKLLLAVGRVGREYLVLCHGLLAPQRLEAAVHWKEPCS